MLVIQVRLLQSFDGGSLTPSQLTRSVRIITDIPHGTRPLPSGPPQERRKRSEAVRGKRQVSVAFISTSLNSEPLIDSAGYLSVMNPSIVNQTLFKFLSRLPRVRSDIEPPSVPAAQRMRQALGTMAELTGDPSFSERDAMCSLSFSCVSPETCKIQVKSRESYAKDAAYAFSPLRSTGRPIR